MRSYRCNFQSLIALSWVLSGLAFASTLNNCQFSNLVAPVIRSLGKIGLTVDSPVPAPGHEAGTMQILVRDGQGKEVGHIRYLARGPEVIEIYHYELDPKYQGKKISPLLIQLALDQMPRARTIYALLDDTNAVAFRQGGFYNTPLVRSVIPLGFTLIRDLKEVNLGGQVYRAVTASLPPGGQKNPPSDSALARVENAFPPAKVSAETLRQKTAALGTVRKGLVLGTPPRSFESIVNAEGAQVMKIEYSRRPLDGVLQIHTVSSSVKDDESIAGLIAPLVNWEIDQVQVQIPSAESTGGVGSTAIAKQLALLGFVNVQNTGGDNYVFKPNRLQPIHVPFDR